MTRLKLKGLLFMKKLAKNVLEISLDYVVCNEFGSLILFNNNILET